MNFQTPCTLATQEREDYIKNIHKANALANNSRLKHDYQHMHVSYSISYSYAITVTVHTIKFNIL